MIKRSKILAVRSGALGDFILTLPALAALRDDGAEVSLVAHPAYAALALQEGLATEVRALESAAMAAFFRQGPVDQEWAEWIGGFDRVISWLQDRDGIFRHQIERCGPVFEQRISRPVEPGAPAAVQLGGAAHYALQWVRGIPKQDVIAVHAGSGGRRKNWPIAHWAASLDRLYAEGRAREFLLVSSEADGDLIPVLTSRLQAPWKSAQNLPLPALAEALAGCRGFLGHDSGPAHLAAACGLPCSLIFGPADPAVWAPQSDRVRVLSSESPPELDFETGMEFLLR